jgi:hypothetical protein
MKIFQCGHCAQLILKATLVKIVAIYQVLEMKIVRCLLSNLMRLFDFDREQIEYRYCKNKEYNVCNWLVKRIPRRILSSLSTKSNDTQPF